MTSPLVTVLTAVRDGQRWLEDAVLSVRAQSVEDWEHVIVDDASSDATPGIAARLAAQDPRVRVLQRAVSGGPYVAANDGLEIARGRYIARLDADDVAAPRRLEAQLRFLAEREGLRACAGFHRVLRPGAEPVVRRFPASARVLSWRLCLAADPAHSSAFVERAAFTELGGYEPRALAQDWRLWSRLVRNGWLGVLPEVVVDKRIHEEALTASRGAEQAAAADEVAREHLREVAGADWPADRVRELREAAHGRSRRPVRGATAIAAWARLWKADADLSDEDRVELGRFTARIRRRHLRRSLLSARR